MIIAEETSFTHLVEVTGGKAPQVFTIHEIRAKFCDKAHEIAMLGGKYDLKNCEPCGHQCTTYEWARKPTNDFI